MSADLGESVTIELDTDKPYVHNGDHVKKYPSKKSKGKKNKSGLKRNSPFGK